MLFEIPTHRIHGGQNNRRTFNVVVLSIFQSPIEVFQLLLLCMNEKKSEKFARLFDTEIVFHFVPYISYYFTFTVRSTHTKFNFDYFFNQTLFA